MTDSLVDMQHRLTSLQPCRFYGSFGSTADPAIARRCFITIVKLRLRLGIIIFGSDRSTTPLKLQAWHSFYALAAYRHYYGGPGEGTARVKSRRKLATQADARHTRCCRPTDRWRRRPLMACLSAPPPPPPSTPMIKVVSLNSSLQPTERTTDTRMRLLSDDDDDDGSHC